MGIFAKLVNLYNTLKNFLRTSILYVINLTGLNKWTLNLTFGRRDLTLKTNLSLVNFYKNINFTSALLQSTFNEVSVLKNKIINNTSTIIYSCFEFLETFTSSKIFFIRKNKMFNKGRYSRNRQLYRTGVYWCLWLNVAIVFAMHFWFYRLTFNFGYIWIGLAIFSWSFLFSRFIQHRLYSLDVFYTELSLVFANLAQLLFLSTASILTFISRIVGVNINFSSIFTTLFVI